MNLWDVKTGVWHERLVALAAGSFGVEDLTKKLGPVSEDGGLHLGTVSKYFARRYGFDAACTIVAFTGDNPSTIIALPLRSLDAVVSLGTSTTFLMSTPEYQPDPATHFFNHPTTAGLYMFMLCYKNGGLAREKVRDAINAMSKSTKDQTSWDAFDTILRSTPPTAQRDDSKYMKMGLYFPQPEIVPKLPNGEWHFNYDPETKKLEESEDGLRKPEDDARGIGESQMLSLGLRSRELVNRPAKGLPPQPRRVYLVGGGSKNKAIAKVIGEILGGSEGVFKLDVGEYACALGGAYKAVWAMERKDGETFEDFIGARWKEDDFVEKIAEGYQQGVFERYGEAMLGFEKMELELLKRYSG